MKAYNIEWDVDIDDACQYIWDNNIEVDTKGEPLDKYLSDLCQKAPEEFYPLVGLPTKVDVPEGTEEEDISNWLSNKYGNKYGFFNVPTQFCYDIDIPEPDQEVVGIWMEHFKSNDVPLEEEIDEIKGTILNERLFQKGSETLEQSLMHAQNIADLSEYLERLEGMQKEEEEWIDK